MLGQFGFSYLGALYLLMLFVPNLIWARRRPAGYDPHGENRALLFCERAGQVLVTCSALFFSRASLRPWSPWSWWLAASFLLMLLYEAWWLRYFRSKRTLADFYGSFLGVPLAGAVLPVLAFLLLGVYAKGGLLVLSSILLGVGHVGIHLQHRIAAFR